MTFFGGGAMSASLKAAVEGLGALAVGMNPLDIEAIVGKIRAAAASSGPGGIFTLALSAIDIALWDIKGKVLNKTVSQLLGGFREKVPTYASVSANTSFITSLIWCTLADEPAPSFPSSTPSSTLSASTSAMPPDDGGGNV